MNKNKWVAVRVKNGYPKRWGRVTFAMLKPSEPNTFYWFGLPGHATYEKGDYEIIRTLGYGIYTSKLEIEFRREFCKPETLNRIKQTAGWIAPTGHIYPCEPWEHDGLAVNITAWLYNSLGGTRLLDDKGWIRLYKEGIHSSPDLITQLQVDSVGLLSRVGDVEWKRHLVSLIRSHETSG